MNTNYMFFELNYKYHQHILFEKDTNPYLRFCLVKKLDKDLRDLILICQQYQLYT